MVYDDFVEVNIPVIGSGVMLRNIQLVSRQERCGKKYSAPYHGRDHPSGQRRGADG